MKIDTSASVSIISSTLQQCLFPDADLKQSSLKLQTNTGEQMKVVGQNSWGCALRNSAKKFDSSCSWWKWSYTVRLELAGTNTRLPILFHWKPANVCPGNAPGKTFWNFHWQAGNSSPIHSAGRHSPIASQTAFPPFVLRDGTEEELNCLEACGILDKVFYSSWAAPIVAVP